MPPDQPRRTQRRRPDLGVNTARARSFTSKTSNIIPSTSPSTPTNRRPPLPSARDNSNSRSLSLKTASAAASMAAASAMPPAMPLPTGSRPPKGLSPAHAAHADVETFLEMYTPVDPTANKENSQVPDSPPPPPRRAAQRDSHDLSLPSSRHVRDSLVSNMLLSLDQMSSQFSPSASAAAAAAAAAASSRALSTFDDPRLFSLTTSTTVEDLARGASMPPSSSSRSGGGGGNGGGSTNGGGGRHVYSYSSDYEGTDDASRVSGGAVSRGRRSNSSSGFQSSLGRINSMREPATPRMVHSRGGKGSKSSSSNSIDTAGYVQVLGSQRWAHGFGGGRSSSLDLGQRAPQVAASQQQPQPQRYPSDQLSHQQQPPWHIEFSNSFFDSPYDDAAPTPTIPGGPRKLNSVPSMPSIPSYQHPLPDRAPSPRGSTSAGPPPERRRSVRSSRSATLGRQTGPKFSAAAAPPVPVAAFDLDSAPAPHVGYEKSKEPTNSQKQPTNQKERPGFFRRVFGSFRDTVSGSEPGPSLSSATSPSTGPPFASSVSVETTASRGALAGQAKAQSTPPSRDSYHSSHAALQKKPSGFFRRRKKSVSEIESPPPLPTPLVLPPTQQQQPPAPPAPTHTAPRAPPLPVPPLKIPTARDDLLPDKVSSPATSLRRAMSPYLKSSPAIANGMTMHPSSSMGSNLRAADDDDDLGADDISGGAQNAVEDETSRLDASRRGVRGFSPDYEPSPRATIRSVEPDQSNEAEAPARHSAKQQHLVDTPTRDPPSPPHPARSGSFLSDNSDSEDSPRHVATRVVTDHRIQQRKSHGQLAAALPADNSLRVPTVPTVPVGDPRRDDPSPATSYHSKGRGAMDNESRGSNLTLPIEGVVSPRSASFAAGMLPTSASMPSLKSEVSKKSDTLSAAAAAASPRNAPGKPIDEPVFVVGDPTDDDRQKALNIFEGNEDFIQKEKAASWMGEEGPVRQRTLQAYMDLHNFESQSIASALRDVCSRLVLRAETQQVDRILVAFSKRWCACNPNHGFKSIDVVHTICYSIMLLNTDLHLADIDTKMTRSQFIKNTMTSIRHTLTESVPRAFDRPSILPGKNPVLISAADAGSSAKKALGDQPSRSAGAVPPSATGSSAWSEHTTTGNADGSGLLVNATFDGPVRGWETQMETVLKDIYSSIRDERLPLFGADLSQAANPSGLSVMGMLKRTPSVLSKTPSDSQNSARGRVAESNPRAGSSRWTSKSRSRVRGPGNGTAAGNGFSSSRTSFEDANSIWSPTGSSATWSRQSLGRTHTSMSMESFGSMAARGDYHQSIGFANALSQAIIREDNALGIGSMGGSGGSALSFVSDDQSQNTTGEQPLLEDESLELAGPPWVKEGLVIHKHHLDGTDKKAKDRNWSEVFAVIQKGHMGLFSFTPSKSLRSKARNRQNGGALPKGAVVGGGNWQENATTLASFSLKQTLASALPPPGYSRQRPHVWALSLPSGAVYLFQVGTPEISREFVTTANYWSARLSTHPLVGGISNIEYGWSDGIVNNALVHAINNNDSSSMLPLQSSGGSGSGSGGGSGNGNGNDNGGTGGGSGGPGPAHPPNASRPGSAAAGRASMQSRGSFRSGSFDFGHVRSGSSSSGFAPSASMAMHSAGSGNRHGKLPGDRIHMADWTPPTQSLRASTVSETQQLQTLQTYVKGIEAELQAHNALRSPMLLAFSPRGHNAAKAMANWERKSSYLLREIVRYRTYVDCLMEAERRRTEIYHERDGVQRAARGDASISTTTTTTTTAAVTDREDVGSVAGSDVAHEPLMLASRPDPLDGNDTV